MWFWSLIYITKKQIYNFFLSEDLFLRNVRINFHIFQLIFAYEKYQQLIRKKVFFFLRVGLQIYFILFVFPFSFGGSGGEGGTSRTIKPNAMPDPIRQENNEETTKHNATWNKTSIWSTYISMWRCSLHINWIWSAYHNNAVLFFHKSYLMISN